MKHVLPRPASPAHPKRAGTALSALTTAALALPGVVASPNLGQAQSNLTSPRVDIKYYQYQDWQAGGQQRMKVNAPMAYFQTPVGESTFVRGSTVYDSMSGASPLYHDTLSGASGKGIHDARWAGDVAVTKKFEQFDLTLGAETSDEHDYRAQGTFLQGSLWTPSKNTTFTFGTSYSDDTITSSNDATLSEGRTSYGGFAGVTQVLSKESIIQTNFSFTTSDGYLSDQYKSLDHRPESRDQFTFLTRYNHYIADLDGALHIDYRYFRDSWSIASNMIETSWYKPVGEHLVIRPLIRYSTQSAASFFSPLFPPDGDTTSGQREFYSADQRVAGFGSVSTGIKATLLYDTSFSLDLLYEFIHQRSSLKLGTPGSASIPSFFAQFYGIGITSRW